MMGEVDDWTIQICYSNAGILKECRGTLCADGYITRMAPFFIVSHFTKVKCLCETFVLEGLWKLLLTYDKFINK